MHGLLLPGSSAWTHGGLQGCPSCIDFALISFIRENALFGRLVLLVSLCQTNTPNVLCNTAVLQTAVCKRQVTGNVSTSFQAIYILCQGSAASCIAMIMHVSMRSPTCLGHSPGLSMKQHIGQVSTENQLSLALLPGIHKRFRRSQSWRTKVLPVVSASACLTVTRSQPSLTRSQPKCACRRIMAGSEDYLRVLFRDLKHFRQASAFLVRPHKSQLGMEDLANMCPSLNVQQLYRLATTFHDDITASTHMLSGGGSEGKTLAVASAATAAAAGGGSGNLDVDLEPFDSSEVGWVEADVNDSTHDVPPTDPLHRDCVSGEVLEEMKKQHNVTNNGAFSA